MLEWKKSSLVVVVVVVGGVDEVDDCCLGCCAASLMTVVMRLLYDILTLCDDRTDVRRANWSPPGMLLVEGGAGRIWMRWDESSLDESRVRRVNVRRVGEVAGEMLLLAAVVAARVLEVPPEGGAGRLQ